MKNFLRKLFSIEEFSFFYHTIYIIITCLVFFPIMIYFGWEPFSSISKFFACFFAAIFLFPVIVVMYAGIIYTLSFFSYLYSSLIISDLFHLNDKKLENVGSNISDKYSKSKINSTYFKFRNFINYYLFIQIRNKRFIGYLLAFIYLWIIIIILSNNQKDIINSILPFSSSLFNISMLLIFVPLIIELFYLFFATYNYFKSNILRNIPKYPLNKEESEFITYSFSNDIRKLKLKYKKDFYLLIFDEIVLSYQKDILRKAILQNIRIKDDHILLYLYISKFQANIGKLPIWNGKECDQLPDVYLPQYNNYVSKDMIRKYRLELILLIGKLEKLGIINKNEIEEFEAYI